jgi:hemolysin-activating ACP:hemolysin acyltransferase
MYYDVAGVKGVADANNRSANEDIGAIVQFAGTRPSHGGMPVAHFSRALSLAHGLGQTKVFYNDFGQCTGFVVWALLAPEVEHRIIKTKRMELRDFEWNEGDSLWIVDFLVRPGSLRSAMEYMRDELFVKYGTVTFGRKRNGNLVFKRTSRDSKSAFWTAASNSNKESA